MSRLVRVVIGFHVACGLKALNLVFIHGKMEPRFHSLVANAQFQLMVVCESSKGCGMVDSDVHSVMKVHLEDINGGMVSLSGLLRISDLQL